jgi:hypothetical protein
MNDELEAKIRRRAREKREGESRPEGLAGRHRLEAEHEVTGEAGEAENSAASRWAAPVGGTYVETSNEAARIAGKAREQAAVRG